MDDRIFVDTKSNRPVEGQRGRGIFAFSCLPALPLKASGEISHRGWDIPSRWACDGDSRWWLDNGHGGGLETCGRPDVLEAASDDPTAFNEIMSVAAEDGLKDMLMLRNTLLSKAEQTKAEAAALYERTAVLEDAIVVNLKKQGEAWEINAASADVCRRMVGELREDT